VIERDRAWQVTGPSGTLVDRVGDHVATANKLLRDSHEVVERLRARVEQTHRRVERTFRRVQEAAAGQALRRSASDASDRFLEIKQRELAAHLAAVELHERAAALQDRLGYPERAAQARLQAEQARRWYRLAGEELEEYNARIQAAIKGRPSPGSGSAT
jgi:hypothetical protein